MPGETLKIEHKIKLVDEEPVLSKLYPLPYALSQEIKDEIKEMLVMGINRKSSWPYASSVVIVRKKDGSNHICIDYKKSSKPTILDPNSMKILNDLFQQLRKSQFFSKINLNEGYWQVPVVVTDSER